MLDVCQEIVSIAREFELLIVAEDVYNLLTYTANSAAPKRLFAYDRMTDAAYKGHVISNGTFSKLLSPGVRLGWMEMPPRCVRVFNVSGLLLSGGATNNYTSGVLATALELDLLVPILQDNINVYGVSLGVYIELSVLSGHSHLKTKLTHFRIACGWLFPFFENYCRQRAGLLSQREAFSFGSSCPSMSTSYS